MSGHTFDAVIREGDRGGAYVEVPFDAESELGSKRPKIRATFDGRPDPPYRGSLLRMGGDTYLLGVLKAIREEIGKGPEDSVRVVVWKDIQVRKITVPSDLKQALAGDETARAAFDALSYTHRKEYVQWIEEAKKPETRERRVAKTLEMVQEGKTR